MNLDSLMLVKNLDSLIVVSSLNSLIEVSILRNLIANRSLSFPSFISLGPVTYFFQKN
jgi:hypothetical protein